MWKFQDKNSKMFNAKLRTKNLSHQIPNFHHNLALDRTKDLCNFFQTPQYPSMT